jgi:raffinose/stachyose/melibiose transport system substrate-binding protein
MSIHVRVLSVLVLLSVVAVGCVVPTVTPAPEAPAEATEAPAPAEEPAEVSEPEEVTLQVWDIWGRDEESKVIETLHGEFEEAHPGVTIERTVKSFEDMKATAKLGLSNPDGPDVAQINQGESDMGALVKAGLLKDLTPYAEQYGWYDKFSQGLVARNSFTPDAEQFGEGNFYGIAPTAEFVGVYYRKDMIKEAGHVPVAFGNLDGWPMFHIHGEFQNVLIPDRYYLDNIMYAWEPGTWNTPENVEAAAKVQEWVEKEYLTPGFEGISYDDSTALFDSGEGAMMITGSWMSSTFAAGPHGENIGFFLFPPAADGQNKLAIGGTSTSYTIREDSPSADLAAEYVDWMMSDRAAGLWVESATVPVVPVDPGALEEGTLFTDLVKAWAQMNANDAVGHYTDWATPTFFDTYSAAGQELMGLQITPEEFVEKLQADYAAHHGYEE